VCGICGFVGPERSGREREVLSQMNEAIHHRGPDDSGSFLTRESFPEVERGPACALAMRRLAVIDLHTGHQPICNEDDSCWIVYNGEVYNYRELRVELEEAGHRFRTDTDTEVVLHAYEQYGLGCLTRLRGMFALAIWDQPKGRLVLARDPVGIKPLFYTHVGRQLIFASEIKGLLAYPGVTRELNAAALPHFLTYLYVPAPETMFADILQLQPGHSLVYENETETVEEFWAGPSAWVSREQGFSSRGQDGPSSSELWNGLSESVSSHLVSDVPVGAFLSGGIDSSAIVAMMAAQMSQQRLRTFSIGFHGAGIYDETSHAELMAKSVGADHQTLKLDSASLERLPEILRHLDEPMADASVISNYFLAEMARKEVTVVLTGIGGDELFGGYRRYAAHAFAERCALVPRFLRRDVFLPALRRLPFDSSTRVGNAVRLADKFFSPLDLPPEERYLSWNSFYTEREKRELLLSPSPSSPSAGLYSRYFERVRHLPFPDQAMYVDLKTYLPGDPLLLGDRLTMAHGLESRVPFLDLKVMELAARIPSSRKLSGLKTKTVLREACRGHIPASLLSRPKQGFGTPIELWLRQGSASLVREILSDSAVRARGIFRPEAVSGIVQTFQKGGRDVSQHLWALIVFELWARAYLDNNYSARKGLSFSDLGVSGIS
jgi:asparagine synthase (glutamine-hydrolysing)